LPPQSKTLAHMIPSSKKKISSAESRRKYTRKPSAAGAQNYLKMQPALQPLCLQQVTASE